jgi:hypothetical protein
MAWLFRCLAVRNSGLNLARKGRRHRYFPFSFLHFLRQFKVFFRPAGLVGHFVRQSAKKCRTFSETVGMSGMSDDLRFHCLRTYHIPSDPKNMRTLNRYLTFELVTRTTYKFICVNFVLTMCHIS